jgi:probable HAF family extracellular repeat protein
MTNKMARRLALSCGAAVSSVAMGQVEYEFYLVDAWNTSYSLREAYVTEINEQNRASGTATGGSSYAGFIWSEATEKTAIPVSSPKGLNNFGVVVDNDFVYDSATSTSTTLAGVANFSVPQLRDINDGGLVVGRAWTGGPCSQYYCYAPYLWDEVNGARVLSAVPDARELVRLNNAGQLLGHIVTVTFDRKQAFVYDLSTSTWEHVGAGLPPQWLAGHPITEAFDISETGSVVGVALWGQEPQHAFLWQPGGLRTLLPALASGEVDYVFPSGVNSSNIVVGRANVSPSGPYRAFIWDQASGMRDLNTLAVLPANFILDAAAKINDHGWIVGYGHFGPGWGTARGFVLKPINQTPPCYANCDGSTTEPVLNVADFSCFLQKFAAGDSYANCDQSTTPPVLNVADFSCFLQKFAGGCQ